MRDSAGLFALTRCDTLLHGPSRLPEPRPWLWLWRGQGPCGDRNPVGQPVGTVPGGAITEESRPAACGPAANPAQRDRARQGWRMGPVPDRQEIGGAKGDRTPDLLHAMQALSQLSYGPFYPL